MPHVTHRATHRRTLLSRGRQPHRPAVRQALVHQMPHRTHHRALHLLQPPHLTHPSGQAPRRPTLRQVRHAATQRVDVPPPRQSVTVPRAQRRPQLTLEQVQQRTPRRLHPLHAHSHSIKYRFSDKNDPLKAELLAQTIGQPTPKQVGRTTLPQSLWQKERFTDTYGRFERTYPEKPPPAARVSHVPMEHYRIARGGDAPREFPLGKKVDFAGQQKRDMRQSLIFKHMETRPSMESMPGEALVM